MKITTEDRAEGTRVTIAEVQLSSAGTVTAYENGRDKLVYQTSFSSARNAVLAVFAKAFKQGVTYPKTSHTVERITPLHDEIVELENKLADLKRRARDC
jgi:hypothetical protein